MRKKSKRAPKKGHKPHWIFCGNVGAPPPKQKGGFLAHIVDGIFSKKDKNGKRVLRKRYRKKQK